MINLDLVLLHLEQVVSVGSREAKGADVVQDVVRVVQRNGAEEVPGVDALATWVGHPSTAADGAGEEPTVDAEEDVAKAEEEDKHAAVLHLVGLNLMQLIQLHFFGPVLDSSCPAYS